MVFFVPVEGAVTFLGCLLPGYAWPDDGDWAPMEARTVEGWFVIDTVPDGKHVLVCPD